MSSDPSEVSGDTVRYTVKELLAEIRDGITAIKSVSAQHELRLSKLEFTVADHGMQLGSTQPQLNQLARIIETQTEVKEALAVRKESAFTRREKALASVVAVLMLLAEVYGVVFR